MVARVSLLGSTSVFRFEVAGSPDAMRVIQFSGEEGVSKQFSFQLKLACENPALDFSQVVGKSAVLSLQGETEPRFVHGIVARFEQITELPHYAIYHAVLVPKVRRLVYRQDCRIFQDMPTPAIIQKVLESGGIAGDLFQLKLSNTYEPRNYCVQYRESDWDFISRLMEEDGIFYFFEHQVDKHILVMGDGPQAHKPIGGLEALPFRRPSGLVNDEEHVQHFHFAEEIQSGQSSLRDFNFKKPDLSMHAQDKTSVDSDLEVYDYPGEYQDPGRGSSAKGATLAKLRLEGWQAGRRVARGESDCERLCPGQMFTLTDHARGDYNARYMLLGVSHYGHQPQVLDEESSGGEFAYSNSFACMAEKTPFRPPRLTPRPQMRGIQTAIVVGPKGEEIYTDEYGRVKVQFHWDREGSRDERSSCWIRVSQLWAGETWGAMFIPRIGQEVIVDFIEGDPDRPIITGRVYNGANPVPYSLPGEKTKSTIKSNTSPGGNGYNELRFEDEKGKEQIFMHAQRNMDVHVKNDSFENIRHDRHQTIGTEGEKGKVGDQNELVFRDKNLAVHRHSQEHVGGDMKLLVGGIDGEGNQDIVIRSNKKELILKNSHLHVTSNLNELVDVTQSLSVGKDLQVKVGQKHAMEAGQEIHLKSTKIVIEAASAITLKGPGGFITIDGSGIAIKGTLVQINTGGTAHSGSGSSPTAPTDAVEAVPTVPTLADDGSKP
ncbi:type VI secretion system tip protein TssI/VgrG [Stigmatella sp. ncwal1]|uniref:Type VI secretion system tip protein TssI/VgrG n=1 Tax=Stigmatella ashevillensis TaxID=2995309 RepID=A0ABT5DED4_9BACT|nr:type VI secretion system tip protein VgrG [Stigmatella ashevillena]MDC0711153.1 type VI secretion system tip protein TssI/VgrG [Stigmatella ashevillena]